MSVDATTPPGTRIPTEDDRRELRHAFQAWTRDPVAADDLTQETLFEAWNSERQPENPEEWRPWLFGVARHILLRWRRDMAKHGQRTAPPPESERYLISASTPCMDWASWDRSHFFSRRLVQFHGDAPPTFQKAIKLAMRPGSGRRC